MTRNGLTALYCRLSLDDGNEGESMSIQSQKAILEDYAKNKDIINPALFMNIIKWHFKPHSYYV